MLLSETEENYLKAIWKLSLNTHKPVNTNAVAGMMQTTAASVTDMLRRLSEKDLLIYEKYKGVLLTAAGQRVAVGLVRKHRLWEVFLVDKLGFRWDEVHAIAEQLEHIQSDELVARLDEFLGAPTVDPHGDPIPNASGEFAQTEQVLLSTLECSEAGEMIAVDEHSVAFLQHLDRLGIGIGVKISVLERIDYDNSLLIQINDGLPQNISAKIAQNLFVRSF